MFEWKLTPPNRLTYTIDLVRRGKRLREKVDALLLEKWTFRRKEEESLEASHDILLA